LQEITRTSEVDIGSKRAGSRDARFDGWSAKPVSSGLNFSDVELAETIRAALESSSDCNHERFFKRHESRPLGWRLLDLVPRWEVKNAPKRSSHASLQEEDSL
jgi:hypothetical protein